MRNGGRSFSLKRIGTRLVGGVTVATAILAGALVNAPLASAAGTTLSAAPASVAPGGSVTGTWAGVVAPATYDWIGVFPNASAPDTGYLSWVYTGGGASGSKAVAVPASATPGGGYQLRLFANNGYTRLATSGAFTVGATAPSAASLSAAPSSVAPGGSVSGTWSGVASPATYDWIGVFPNASAPDTGYLSWVYTGGGASGSKAVAVPASATPGSGYQLRLFANNGYTRLATSGAFTVASATPPPAAGNCAAAEQPYAQYTKTVPVTAQDVINAEHATLYLVNVERSKAGLPALCWNTQLAGAGRGHAENWRGVDRTCPAHPQGSWYGCSHWDSRAGQAWPENRIAASGYAASCGMACLGENTQNGGGVSNGSNWVPAGMTWGTPEVAVYWWMNHDNANNGHRAAILKTVFKDGGVGIATYKDAWNNNAAAFVLNFGSRG